MHRLFFIISVFILSGFSSKIFTQNLIEVAIPYKVNECKGKDHLGFVYASLPVSLADESGNTMRKMIDFELAEKSLLPEGEKLMYTFNNKTDIENQQYVVVISASAKDFNGCVVKHYGLGFGKDKNEALQKSKMHLSLTGFDWKEEDEYTLELDKNFSE